LAPFGVEGTRLSEFPPTGIAACRGIVPPNGKLLFGSSPNSAIEVEGLSIQQVGGIAAGRESRIHLIL